MAVTEPTLISQQSETLLRLTHVIEAATTLGELVERSLTEFTQLFAVPYGGIVMLNHAASSAEVLCEVSRHHALCFPFIVEASPELRHAVEQRQVAVLHDHSKTAFASPFGTVLHERGVRSALLLPLVAQDRAIGVLVMGADQATHEFDAGAVVLARALAGTLAVSIVATQANESARRRNEELTTLNEIATAVTSTLDTHEVYLLVVQKLNKYFDVDAGSILLMDEASGDLRFVMTIEGGEEKLAGITVPVGQGVVGHVAQTGTWEIVHDAQRDPRFYAEVSESVGYVTRSILCVPIVAKGRVIGAIELLNKLHSQFTEDDAQRLSRMSAFIGVAIENALLFQQVADGRDRLEAILNSTDDGILMADVRGVIRDVNPMAADLLGEHQAHLLGSSLDDLLTQLHGRAYGVVPGSRTGDAGLLHTVSEIELGGTRRRFLRLFRMPVLDEAGRMYGQLALLRDTTQEKELEQLREDYTGMLVHDLRAPLTSIMNGIAMVQRGLGGPVTDQQVELLNIASYGSQTMLELINNMLDISKMEQGRLLLDLEPLVPYTVVDSAIERLVASAQARHITISQQLAVGLPTIEADRNKLERVLQNLLDNALKFSQARTTVIIGAYRYSSEQSTQPNGPTKPPLTSGEWLVLWVRDFGPGIPTMYHERIFEKFGQVHGRKLRGTGIGLTFCKLAVEAHNGRIWLESTEGAGSVFAFALPISSDHDHILQG